MAKEVHAELLEIRIREIGQQIQIDRVALEMLSVLANRSRSSHCLMVCIWVKSPVGQHDVNRITTSQGQACEG